MFYITGKSILEFDRRPTNSNIVTNLLRTTLSTAVDLPLDLLNIVSGFSIDRALYRSEFPTIRDQTMRLYIGSALMSHIGVLVSENVNDGDEKMSYFYNTIPLSVFNAGMTYVLMGRGNNFTFKQKLMASATMFGGTMGISNFFNLPNYLQNTNSQESETDRLKSLKSTENVVNIGMLALSLYNVSETDSLKSVVITHILSRVVVPLMMSSNSSVP